MFYATGAWKRPVLGFDGEEFTEFGLQFLMEVNQWMNKRTAAMYWWWEAEMWQWTWP